MNKSLVEEGQRYGERVVHHYGPESFRNAMAPQLFALGTTYATPLWSRPQDMHISSYFYLQGILFAHIWAQSLRK